MTPDDSVRAAVEAIYRTESRWVLATLIRLLGDFDLAEEALHDAFAVALIQWSREGIPAHPRAWLVSTGRFRAIDALRRRARFDHTLLDVASQVEAAFDSTIGEDPQAIEDDQLRLIFTCCHPALKPEAQAALTLREVCGLTTEEIARAYLSTAPTIAQRIVRAKAKIRDARIPYQVPEQHDLAVRLESVLQVIYLVFTEGYSASSGEELIRHDLSGEAIRLGRLLVALLPEPEAVALLALMLLQESRRDARLSAEGELLLLEAQDRSQWNRTLIEEGVALVEQVLRAPSVGPRALQAAIAAVHAESTSPATTDWPQIVILYNLLLLASPTPVVELNRAVAVAMCEGPDAGLALIDGILSRGELTDFHLAHAARADLLRRLGRVEEARSAYQRAAGLAQVGVERRFLEGRIRALES